MTHRIFVNLILMGVLVVMGSTLQAVTTTLNATDDAEIDGHVNWRGDTKGIPHPEWSHAATELRVRIYDPIDYPDANASYVLLKWDVSAITATDAITAVTLEMSGWDGSDGPIDVYGIKVGDWDESTVTWNNWAATTQSLVLLGQLTCVGSADMYGQTTFSDPDLTALVRQWIVGSQNNYGLILKKSGSAPGGDSFSSREDTWASGHAPQLIIAHEPAAAAGTISLDAVGDAEIDGHANWQGDTKGIPHPEWGWDASELRIRTYDPAEYPDANASHALIKWDVSVIAATDAITAVTLEMSGWDGSDGPIEVYAIDEGDWDESIVTWNSWEATTKSIVLLGYLTCAGPANTAGQTTFSDPDLTTWVQDWVDGSQGNHGLILKMSNDGTPGGDSFSSREDTWASGHAPRLIIAHEPATVTINGIVVISGYVGDLSLAGVQIELRQGGVPVKTERTLLDAGGGFSIPDVASGTYDIAFKVCSQLQKVVSGVNVTVTPNVGTITLQGGDLNGDGLINIQDIGILAASWLAVENP
jgi:hypothetical protein